jgi:hypothetical protein
MSAIFKNPFLCQVAIHKERKKVV